LHTIAAIVAESQAMMLNTLTKQGLQNAFKNSRKSGNGVYGSKRNNSRTMMIGGRQDVNF
jgi:hypothetical protein